MVCVFCQHYIAMEYDYTGYYENIQCIGDGCFFNRYFPRGQDQFVNFNVICSYFGRNQFLEIVRFVAPEHRTNCINSLINEAHYRREDRILGCYGILTRRQEELDATREELAATGEELAATREELAATREELAAIREELAALKMQQESVKEHRDVNADRAPHELLSPQHLPEVSGQDSKSQGPKRCGRGTFSYKKHGLSSDQQADEPSIDDDFEDDTVSHVPEESSDKKNSSEARQSIQCPFTVRALCEEDELLSSIPPRDLESPRKDHRHQLELKDELLSSIPPREGREQVNTK